MYKSQFRVIATVCIYSATSGITIAKSVLSIGIINKETTIVH